MAAYRFVSSSRGKQKLVHLGFIYRHQRTRGTNHYFRCEREACNGTAILRNVPTYNSDGGVVDVGRPHHHAQEEGREPVLRMLERVREDAKRTNVPPSGIMQQNRQDVPVEAAANMPSEDAVRQVVGRVRRRNVPPEPITRGGLEIPPHMRRTRNGEEFLLFDTFEEEDDELGADEGEDRIIAFATRRNLEQLAECNMWYMDGTFKACPNLFTQIYTINGVKDGKSFPYVFALLPSKTRLTYETFFRELRMAGQEFNIQLAPPHIMVDFEQAVVAEAKNAFPNAQIHGCLFHLGQSLYRRVQAEGLAAQYRDNEELNLAVKKLIALSFLRPDEVVEGFAMIEEQAPQEATPIYRYFQDTYIRGRAIVIRGKGRRPRNPPRHPPLFPPELWSMHSLQESGMSRTNNVQEAWHRRFNEIVGRCHVGVHLTIKEFTKEQHRTEQELARIEHGKKAGGRVPRTARQREQRIATIFAAKEELGMETYIRRMARNMGTGRRGEARNNNDDEAATEDEEDENPFQNPLFP